MNSIKSKISEHPTGTLAIKFHKPAGEENPYVRFGYVPQKISNHTRGQLSVSMNSDVIDSKIQAKNQQLKDDN